MFPLNLPRNQTMMDYLERPQAMRSRSPVGEHRVKMKSLESHPGHDTYGML
jgi:hypothetical protein